MISGMAGSALNAQPKIMFNYGSTTVLRCMMFAAAIALAASPVSAEIVPLEQNLQQADWLNKRRQNGYGPAATGPSKKSPIVKVSKSKWLGGPRPAITPKAPSTVRFRSGYQPGTIVIDTSRRRLFYVLDGDKALRYPIAVGRAGFQWSGNKTITRVQNWPDWRPPAEMRRRQPNLPKVMTGGLYNPLGAKALYLGSSLYRIHGTANAKSIGTASSSGCFRMLNSHVTDLAQRAGIGTQVIVLRRLPKAIAHSIGAKTSS